MTDHTPRSLIAVVDDDRRVLESLEALLESADYAVRVFDSPGELLKSDCLTEIDAVISDIGMPVTDGFELLRLIREVRPELPAIFVTGRTDMLNRLPDSGKSRARVFIKPFDGQALLEALVDALHGATSRGHSP